MSKRKLRESLREFFRLHDQLTQNKIKIYQWNVAIIFKRFAVKSTNTAMDSKRKIDEISWQMIDQVKAFERQYTTTNSDVLTTISTATTTCLKSFDARNARLERETTRSQHSNRRHHRQIQKQKQKANVAVLKNTNSTK